MIRLVGDRYNEESDILTIVTDRCPLRKQNYDYGIYVLTALYHESNVSRKNNFKCWMINIFKCICFTDL